MIDLISSERESNNLSAEIYHPAWSSIAIGVYWKYACGLEETFGIVLS
jgi:hypothetical protein